MIFRLRKTLLPIEGSSTYNPLKIFKSCPWRQSYLCLSRTLELTAATAGGLRAGKKVLKLLADVC